MISLPVQNYPVVEDLPHNVRYDVNDLNMPFTWAEHEFMIDLLNQAAAAIEFAAPYGMYDLPIDSEMVQRYTMIENLRERFNSTWSDRFSAISENEIH